MTADDESMNDGNELLIGIRLREGMSTDDYKLVDFQLHVGDLAVVETASGTAVGEVRRPSRPLPEFKRDRLYRRVLRPAGKLLICSANSAWSGFNPSPFSVRYHDAESMARLFSGHGFAVRRAPRCEALG